MYYSDKLEIFKHRLSMDYRLLLVVMQDSIDLTLDSDVNHVIDLTRSVSIGELYFGNLEKYSLDFDDVCDFLQEIGSLFVDGDLKSYSNVSSPGLIFRTSNRKTCIVCVVERFDSMTGEVYVRISEKPDTPLKKIYADLIGSDSLYRLNEGLMSFQDMRYGQISFGQVVPERMIGDVIKKQVKTSFFGIKITPIAVQDSTGTYTMSALVDIDNSDNVNPLIVRHSADYAVSCIKMALGPKIRWMR